MTDRLLTPSKITAWLDCAHFLTLKHPESDGTLAHQGARFGSLARLLADKGLEHEGDCLAEYATGGRSVLERSDVPTLAALAWRDDPVDGVRPERLVRLAGQAALQVEARQAPDAAPPYRIIEPSGDPSWGAGFTFLPEPDDGDVFLDFEGHPFWRADAGLFFLLGLIRAEPGEPPWVHRRLRSRKETGACLHFGSMTRRLVTGR